MNEPTIEELLAKVPSKYDLVLIAAKRARQLTQLQRQSGLPEERLLKPVSAALREISQGKVRVAPQSKRTG